MRGIADDQQAGPVPGVEPVESNRQQLHVIPACHRADVPGHLRRDARDLERRVAAQRGEAPAQVLTLRQLEVLALLCEGRSNKRIAHELDLAEQTVKGHVTAIFRGLRVLSRTQAMLRARELGLLPSKPPD